jgi:hypothetical protein
VYWRFCKKCLDRRKSNKNWCCRTDIFFQREDVRAVQEHPAVVWAVLCGLVNPICEFHVWARHLLSYSALKYGHYWRHTGGRRRGVPVAPVNPSGQYTGPGAALASGILSCQPRVPLQRTCIGTDTLRATSAFTTWPATSLHSCASSQPTRAYPFPHTLATS